MLNHLYIKLEFQFPNETNAQDFVLPDIYLITVLIKERCHEENAF